MNDIDAYRIASGDPRYLPLPLSSRGIHSIYLASPDGPQRSPKRDSQPSNSLGHSPPRHKKHRSYTAPPDSPLSTEK